MAKKKEPKKVILDRIQTKLLWDAIIDKYNDLQEVQLDKDDLQFFKDHNELLKKGEKPLVSDSYVPIYETLYTSQNLTINPKCRNLYMLFRAIMNKHEQFVLASTNKKLFTTFLGDEVIKNIKAQKSNSVTTIQFKGLYYSRNSNNIGDFTFRISISGKEAIGYLQGFHDSYSQPFIGPRTIIGKYWHFHLKYSDIFIDLTIDNKSNSQNMSANNFKAILSGLGSEDTLLSCETILINEKSTNLANDIKSARKYLFLKRKNFRVDPLEKSDGLRLDQINVIPDLPISRNDVFLNKTFRIISLTPSQREIAQSKMVTSDEFTFNIIYPTNSKEQTKGINYPGLMTVKPGHSHRLFLTAYLKDILHASTVIETHKGRQGYYLGAFQITDVIAHKKVAGGTFYLIEDSEMKDEDVSFTSIDKFVSEVLKELEEMRKQKKRNQRREVLSHIETIIGELKLPTLISKMK